MARFAVGDIQGCFDELQLLVERMGFEPGRDTLYLVGDLVNRGPDSAAVLRWAKRHDESVRVVLGNHDLSLLALSAGVGKARQGDTMAAVLEAGDSPALLDWLRLQPLLLPLEDVLIVHAGIWPGWTQQQAIALAGEVQVQLAAQNWREGLAQMYGNQPASWDETLDGWPRWRFVVNALTRMRFVDAAGALQLKFKGELTDAPAGLYPWFDWPERISTSRIVCGHWSALGLRVRDQLIALDTGCIWGGALTGIDLDCGRLYQVPARREYQSLLPM
ncbi:symmetrical bis(5'-nucleosyl)-tetraphosphatase [Jeongeupia naejangsanensis]|uniref:bis(5'-nucleosyl)-tetraphosphatase (symmetrical) n=1 Tax=Jeongeupia naejangsanensis TaxID=613195 RepID=A0ABS2BQI7_9NEIS|nr:symmetrical bis(5'-nucleosyl)-tetraphosphatase [Jeongeupia naejangsanensis]MBM3117710.1 symmetrical bis(5'-nucleosyl)-tetraphosphatase [Jeongeupia naejangsanensis]